MARIFDRTRIPGTGIGKFCTEKGKLFDVFFFFKRIRLSFAGDGSGLAVALLAGDPDGGQARDTSDVGVLDGFPQDPVVLVLLVLGPAF